MNRVGTVFGILPASAAGLAPGYKQTAGVVLLAHATISTVVPQDSLLETTVALPRRFGVTGDGALAVLDIGTDGGVKRMEATENFLVQSP